MSLNKRSRAILQELIQRKSYVSLEELMERLNVSRRTIYYEVDRINDWLKQRQFDPISYKRARGFYLTEVPEDFTFQDAVSYEYSVEERMEWIVLHLLISEQRLLIKDFEDWLDVSRNTVIDDLKKIKKVLESYQLELIFHRQEGYIVQGTEVDKRKALVYNLSYFLSHQKNRDLFLKQIQFFMQIPEINLNPLFDILSECERELQVHYTDTDLYQMALQIFLNMRRILRKQHIEMDAIEKTVIADTAEFQAAQKAAQKLGDYYQIPFPNDEIYYLATQLLSARLQHRYRTTAPNHKQESLKKAIRHMIEDFQLYAGVDFQNEQEFEENLLIHLQPAYYRSKYGLKLQNPLTEVIKEKYQDIFLITKKVIHHFEKLTEQPLHADEVAFIAIHFGGWLRKEGQEPMTRIKALIICNSGVGTSAILRKQLEHLFPSVDFYKTISAREYERQLDWPDISFAISTVPVNEKDHPLFVIHPILTEAEKIALGNRIYAIIGKKAPAIKQYSIEAIMGMIRKHADIIDEQGLKSELQSYLQANNPAPNHYRPSLTQMLENHIQIIDSAKNWRDAIQIASEPLLKHKKISLKYVEAMIQHIEEKGPYMIIAPGIAFPHAKPEEGVLDIGMSLLLLQQPVAF